jgi:hypothetical protein
MQTTNTLEALATREFELDTLRLAKRADLGVAEELAGSAVLNGAAAGEIDRILRLRGEINAFDLAIDTVRSRRPAAIIETFEKKSRQLRNLANEKRAELDGLNVKAARLLRDLSQLEGVGHGRFEPSGGDGFARPETKRERLAREIEGLLAQSRTFEQAQVPTSGALDNADNVVVSDDAVVLAVLRDMSASPSAADLRAWLAGIEIEVLAKHPDRSRAELQQLPRRVRIVWSNGVISHSESYVFYPQLAPVIPSVLTFGAPAGLDVSKATFKVAA